jgi:hypothetical protein
MIISYVTDLNCKCFKFNTFSVPNRAAYPCKTEALVKKSLFFILIWINLKCYRYTGHGLILWFARISARLRAHLDFAYFYCVSKSNNMKHHAKKAYRRMELQYHAAAFTQGKSHQYPMNRSLSEPQSQSGCYREEKSLSMPQI